MCIKSGCFQIPHIALSLFARSFHGSFLIIDLPVQRLLARLVDIWSVFLLSFFLSLVLSGSHSQLKYYPVL